MHAINLRGLVAATSTGVILAGMSGIVAIAEAPRARLLEGDADKTDMRECLTTAVEAANAENLEGFCDCFAGASRPSIRKHAVMRFVRYDVSMELVDAHVVKAAKTTGEVAVRYRLALSDDRFDVVSLVAMKQEHGYWRIRTEKIQSYEHQSPSTCSPSRYACLGAGCRVATR
jgi:hypothetical protein